MAGKNWRSLNGKIWGKEAEKRPENIFYNSLVENHIIICYFLDFCELLL
jgi:hypothetical protein